jgi:hypothetical protein
LVFRQILQLEVETNKENNQQITSMPMSLGEMFCFQAKNVAKSLSSNGGSIGYSNLIPNQVLEANE